MRNMRIRISVVAVSSVLVFAGLFYSCGGGGSGGGGTPSGNVAVFLTDDFSAYKQVTATINKIQLLNTGSGNTCDVLTSPVTVDLTNLAGVMQLINVASCPAVSYNRIHIEFAKSVELTNAAGTSSACTFTSFLDERSMPNALVCGTDTCTLDINGAVNVLASQNNRMALDFDLKKFTVDNFGAPACSVTMKVSPMNASDMDRTDHQEAMTGLVSSLSTSNRTFTLTRDHSAFTVLYSGITSSQQPGLDMLLQRAQDDRLRAKVMASTVDLDGRSITAQAVYVKVEGNIGTGSLDTTAHTFSVVYSSGATTKSISVDYSTAAVEGALAEGTWVDVKLYGYTTGWFLARMMEVEHGGTMTED